MKIDSIDKRYSAAGAAAGLGAGLTAGLSTQNHCGCFAKKAVQNAVSATADYTYGLSNFVLENLDGDTLEKIANTANSNVMDAVDEIKPITDLFNNTDGKELYEKTQSATKKLKNTKIKWVAGLAAAGTAIGAGVAFAVSKLKNKQDSKGETQN